MRTLDLEATLALIAEQWRRDDPQGAEFLDFLLETWKERVEEFVRDVGM